MPKVTTDLVVETYQQTGGNVCATARKLGIGRASIYHHLEKAGIDRKKKLAEGNTSAIVAIPHKLPRKSDIKRYILTSAQNNTHVNEPVWNNVLALADHYDAQIMVGTFTYNKNAYGQLSVKRGTKGDDPGGNSLWYDPEIKRYIVDERHQLAPGLQWCGEMNILPTAVNPLVGFETYTGRDSSIFPQVKFAMRSIASGRYEATKFTYTTGTVTKRNYIQKREGLKAEHHHCYGALLVEVNSDGDWWVRQLNATEDGVIYDLDIVVEDGTVYENDRIEAITWGDSHELLKDEDVCACSQRLLDELRPKYQFIHDVMVGAVTSHWTKKSLHNRFRNYARSGGWNDLKKEILGCVKYIRNHNRNDSLVYIVDANHDRPWIEKWLDSRDGLEDPKNALMWLKLNVAMYEAMEKEPFERKFHIFEYACHMLGLKPEEATFLREDESFIITPAHIECGMHGHLGPDGARGSVGNLSKMARKSNIGHCHKAGIYDGLYAAGVSCDTQSDAWYMRGPSSWSYSHIITYPNGKRTIVTVWKGKYRA